MKLKKNRMAVIAALVLTVPIWTIEGCSSHPAYKLKSGESSKVRVIEKDGKLVTLEVKQDGVTEIDATSERKPEAKAKPQVNDKLAVKADKVAESDGTKASGKSELNKRPKAGNKSGSNERQEADDKSGSNEKPKAGDKLNSNGKSDAKENTDKASKKEKPAKKEKKKPVKGKKKVWVPAVYKIVKHPAVKKKKISVHWVCQCGEVFYSDEEWQAHRPKP